MNQNKPVDVITSSEDEAWRDEVMAVYVHKKERRALCMAIMLNLYQVSQITLKILMGEITALGIESALDQANAYNDAALVLMDVVLSPNPATRGIYLPAQVCHIIGSAKVKANELMEYITDEETLRKKASYVYFIAGWLQVSITEVEQNANLKGL